MKETPAPWGPGTQYETYEEYWEAEVLQPLREAYKKLTGEDAEI